MEVESKVSAHGSGAVCPTCGKRKVFEHPDGQLRHCFACGVNVMVTPLVGVDVVLEKIFKASHQHLLKSAEARTYLVDERKLHPQVLVDSMIGVVPPDLDVTQLLVPMIEAAERALERVSHAALPS